MKRQAMVEIFDPARPGGPVRIVPAAFSPGLGHVRWEYRPTAVPQDWLGVVVGVMGIADQVELPENAERLAEARQAAEAIGRFRVTSIENLTQVDQIPGVNSELLAKLTAWARQHPHLPAVIPPWEMPIEEAPAPLAGVVTEELVGPPEELAGEPEKLPEAEAQRGGGRKQQRAGG